MPDAEPGLIATYALTRPCPACGGPTALSEQYDSNVCPACGTWANGPCGDPHCDYCKDRPAKPAPELLAAARAWLETEEGQRQAERSKASSRRGEVFP